MDYELKSLPEHIADTGAELDDVRAEIRAAQASMSTWKADADLVQQSVMPQMMRWREDMLSFRTHVQKTTQQRANWQRKLKLDSNILSVSKLSEEMLKYRNPMWQEGTILRYRWMLLGLRTKIALYAAVIAIRDFFKGLRDPRFLTRMLILLAMIVVITVIGLLISYLLLNSGRFLNSVGGQ